MHNFKKDSDKFETESQMTLHVLRQLPIYGSKVQRHSHVLDELNRYHESITDQLVDFH